jgi:hypothetical protein
LPSLHARSPVALQIVQAGAAAAAAAPLLRPGQAEAADLGALGQALPLGSRFSKPYDKSPTVPVITIFDHRGCQRGSENRE